MPNMNFNPIRSVLMAFVFLGGVNLFPYFKVALANEVIIPVPHEAQKPIAGSGGKQKVVALIHDPQYDARDCISVQKDPSLYGGIVNSCNYTVMYNFCNYHPKKDSWAAAFDCEQKQGTVGGTDVIGPNKTQAAHVRATESTFIAACMYRDANGKYIDSGPRGVAFDSQKIEYVYSCNVKDSKERSARQKEEQAERNQLAREEQAKAERERQKQQLAQQKEKQAGTEQPRSAQQRVSPSVTSSTTKVALPKPDKGAIDAPVIWGSNTNGPTTTSNESINNNGNTHWLTKIFIVAPESWRTRTLTLPAGLTALKPVDFFIEMYLGSSQGETTTGMFPGVSKEEADRIRNRFVINSGNKVSSCSQVLGKTTVAWTAALVVQHQLPEENSAMLNSYEYTNVIVCGAASLEEAIATTYDQAKTLAGNRPFKSYKLQAAVSAELDIDQLQREGRFSGTKWPIVLAPWHFECRFPDTQQSAQGIFVPQDPGSGLAFSQYIKSIPDFRNYEYMSRTYDGDAIKKKGYFGCARNLNTPTSYGPPPVFAPR